MAQKKELATAEEITVYHCNDCDQVVDPDDAAYDRLYECGSCGETFRGEDAPNGRHQCPSCNKFGSRTDSKAGKNDDVPVCESCIVEMDEEEGRRCDTCGDVMLNNQWDTHRQEHDGAQG